MHARRDGCYRWVVTRYTTLSAAWNSKGRAYFAEWERRLAQLYGAKDADVNLELPDPRTEHDGAQVLNALIECIASGRWWAGRELFDPAYSPLLPHIKRGGKQLGFVTILGEDELLVRRGSPWEQDAETFHLKGGVATRVPDVCGMARSRNRVVLLLARAGGLEMRDAAGGLEGALLGKLPWPEAEVFCPRGLPAKVEARWAPPSMPLEIEQLQVSDDGMRVAMSVYRAGILLGSRQPGEPTWQLLMPDTREPYEWGEHLDDDDDDELSFDGDMTHVAMSPDGMRFAFGEQSSPHYLAALRDGKVEWYGSIGGHSEYPHNACFSDEGAFVALNSCHFYSGATLVAPWQAARGLDLAFYEKHAVTTVVDQNLRVYASTWVPGSGLPSAWSRPDAAEKGGAFLLAGSGLLIGVRPDGQLLFAQGFGSSASSIDYCPITGLLALGSYSGMLHLYDVKSDELPGRIDGWRARREVKRWLMWSELPNGPIAW